VSDTCAQKVADGRTALACLGPTWACAQKVADGRTALPYLGPTWACAQKVADERTALACLGPTWACAQKVADGRTALPYLGWMDLTLNGCMGLLGACFGSAFWSVSPGGIGLSQQINCRRHVYMCWHYLCYILSGITINLPSSIKTREKGKEGADL
jgi:hypothetical protein